MGCISIRDDIEEQPNNVQNIKMCVCIPVPVSDHVCVSVIHIIPYFLLTLHI